MANSGSARDATLTVGGQAFEVCAISGAEKMSAPYRFDVRFGARGAELDDAIVGQRARLSLVGPDGVPRSVRGVVARLEALGHARAGQDEVFVYDVRVVPEAWLLGKRRRSRIFQDMSAVEIVDAVLEGASIERAWKLSRAYEKREYCVQYDETDHRFVQRLLAEEGVFYFFRQPPDEQGNDDARETLVLADAAVAYEPIPGSTRLARRAGGALHGGENIDHLTMRRAVKSGSALVSAFDFKRPQLRVEARAEARSELGEDAYTVVRHDLDVEEHGVDERGAQVLVDQLRARAVVATGSSACRRLAVGATFEVDDPLDALDGQYVVAELDHEGTMPVAWGAADASRPVYKNTFRCVPATVAYRPKRPRRRIHQVTETAFVVGPKGEDIHVDELGRVKVQFHWDRAGAFDESSSCWLRTMQAWAGAAWGSQFVPRVGMEVVVTFVGGDIDRPMILGAVYNGANPPPFSLPAHKTRSGVRTASTPGGKGANELRFEDAAGAEQIYVHAQRDLDVVVEHDHSHEVRGDHDITVEKNATLEVMGDHLRTVHGSEVLTVEADLVLNVRGRKIIKVDGVPPAGANVGAKHHEEQELPHQPLQMPPLLPAESPGAAAKALSGKAATLTWRVEQLDDGAHYARAKKDEARAAEVATSVRAAEDASDAAHADVAQRFATGGPAAVTAAQAELQDRIAVAQAKSAAARALSDQAMQSALEPAPPGMHRAQTAAVEYMVALDKRLDRVDLGLDQLGGVVRDPTPFAAGVARGGGGGGRLNDAQSGDITFKGVDGEGKDKETKKPGGSVVHIDGAGEFVAKEGFRIQSGDASIELVDGNVVIRGAQVKIIGAPIRLN